MNMPRVFETVAEDGVIHLPSGISASAHCVVTVLDGDLESLSEQAQASLSDQQQQRMSDLLSKNRQGTISAAQRDELDELAAEFDRATLAKGRALAALANTKLAPPKA